MTENTTGESLFRQLIQDLNQRCGFDTSSIDRETMDEWKKTWLDMVQEFRTGVITEERERIAREFELSAAMADQETFEPEMDLANAAFVRSGLSHEAWMAGTDFDATY